MGICAANRSEAAKRRQRVTPALCVGINLGLAPRLLAGRKPRESNPHEPSSPKGAAEKRCRAFGACPSEGHVPRASARPASGGGIGRPFGALRVATNRAPVPPNRRDGGTKFYTTKRQISQCYQVVSMKTREQKRAKTGSSFSTR